jgi:esterase/lipase superfamily enzyme
VLPYEFAVMMSAFVRFVGAAVLLTLLSGCTRPPELVGIDNAAIPVASVEGATKRKVFLVTTREASEVVGAFNSDQRAPELGFASVTVSIPQIHVAGEIERPKHLPPDPQTEFAIVDPQVFASDAVFVSRINRELAKLPPEDREILFFVHGYNNTVSDSLLRIAQFSEDTGSQGSDTIGGIGCWRILKPKLAAGWPITRPKAKARASCSSAG